MTTNSAASASDRYLETAAVTHAYRCLGKAGGTLVCLQHGTDTAMRWGPHGDSHIADLGHRVGDR